jgi:hypothetical protein
LLSGRDIRRHGALVIGSVSRARSLGNAFRRAVAEGADPVGAVLAAGSGKRLFEGRVLECPWRDEAALLEGEALITSSGDFAPSRYRVRFKNEKIVTVIGFAAPAIWRTSAGLEVFGPNHFGLDVPYVPLL